MSNDLAQALQLSVTPVLELLALLQQHVDRDTKLPWLKCDGGHNLEVLALFVLFPCC